MPHAHAQARPSALPLLLLLLALVLPHVAAMPAPWPGPHPPRREGAPRAAAPAAGAWTGMASMSLTRTQHTATLLPDGRVLVAGGLAGTPLASVEIYDPLRNRWSPAASLATARYEHTATLLPDGSVLVVGGTVPGGERERTASAERYDPASNTWSSAGSLATARASHTATLLAGGGVLVVGGEPTGAGGSGMASAERYDPAANTWSSAGSLATARADHTANLLPNGAVLVAGGSGSAGQTAELYNPASNSWSATGSLLTARYEHTATTLRDGSVLAVGGSNTSRYLASAERYNPATGRWAAAGNLRVARYDHGAALLLDGTVVVTGGNAGGSSVVAERYDPATNTWANTGAMGAARQLHTTTLLPDGSLLAVGGTSNVNSLVLATAERYESFTPRWVSTASLAGGRYNHTATALPDGTVLVAGGQNTSTSLASAERYNPATNTWSGAGSLAEARSSHTATLLPDGTVLVVGGSTSSGGSSTILGTVERYDPATNTWRPAASLNQARINHSATLLPDGTILVVGGRDSFFITANILPAERYDPVADRWTLAPSPAIARYSHPATLLADGTVLVAGGTSNNAAERYDPATNTWSSAGSLTTTGITRVSVLLPDGTVLTLGSVSDTPVSYERYDPATNSWSRDGTIAGMEDVASAALLPDGTVLAVGTSDSGAPAAARYDPASNSWSPISATGGGQSVTPLPDGELLFVGGAGGGNVGLGGVSRFSLDLGIAGLPRPQLAAASSPVAYRGRLTLAGTGFTTTVPAGPGVFPLLRLRSLESGMSSLVGPDTRYPLSDTSFTSAPLPADFPPGYALASVVVGGVSSAARVVYVNSPPRIAPLADQRHPMRQDGDDAPLTLTVAMGDAETRLERLRVSARADDDTLVPAVEVLPGATPDTRTLRIATPPFAWGQTRVTVRVDDGLDVSERSFGLEVPREAPAWLVLLYLAGDDIPSALTASTDEGAAPGTPVRGVRADSLTTHLDRLIERLADTKQLPFNQDMRLVVLYDGAGAGDSKIYVREGDPLVGGDSGLVDITCLRRPDGSCVLNRPWETYPVDRELDTGSAATLGNFIDWARRQYAGSRYTMLSIVDHGGGWAPDGGSTDQPRAGKTWQLGAWRGLNLDYSSNSALSTKELSRALAGRAPFDVLFVDACLMAMAEVAHELGVTPSSVAGRPIADYLVAGENLLWARLPYEQYLGPGALDAATTPRMLAERIVQRYNLVDPGTPDTPDPLIPGRRSVNASVEPFAIAALDLREAVALTPAIERLAQGLLADLPPEPDDPGDPAALAAYQAALRAIPVTGAITRAHRLAQQFDYDLSLSLGPNDGYVDLADFADQLAAQPAVAAPLRQLAQQISAAIKARVVIQSRYRSAQIVLPTGVRTWDFARAYGLAIYAPIGEQDCRITGPLLDAAPTPAQLSRGAFRCALPRPEQQYVAVPGPLGAVSQYLVVERQLGYYRNPAQLAFSADAPSWAALMSRLDWLAAARDPDPYDPSGRPYNPVSQPELGLIVTRDLADGGCLLISELDFALEQCLPPASVPPFSRLTHTDLLTSSVAFRPGDTPLYAWRLGVTGEGGTRVPAPATPGTITFTFTEQLLAEPDIAFDRLQVLGWDGARWHTLPATAFDPAARRLSVPLQRFNRYALVSRIAGAGLDNLAAEAADLVTSPPLPQAGQPVSLTLTLHRASGKDPLEDVRVRFEYQLAGEPRRVIGEQVAPLLSPRSEADTLPLVWEPPAAGLVTLFATIDPGLEIADDDKGDNVISRTLTVRPPSVDPVAPRVAAFDIAGGAPQTTQPQVALRLGAEDPAPSSGIAAMRVIEYRYSAASGRWEYAQDSGWLPYEPAFAWTLRGDPGVKYLHAWVRDGAGNLSPYPYRALISLLAPGSSLAAGGAHVYRFTLRAGECLAAALAPGDDAGLVVWGQGPGGARLIAASAGALVARAGALGTYQLEVHGAVAGRYDLAVQLVAAGAPGCDGQAATGAPAGPGVAPPAAPRVPITSVPDDSPPGAGWQGPRHLPLVWR